MRVTRPTPPPKGIVHLPPGIVSSPSAASVQRWPGLLTTTEIGVEEILVVPFHAKDGGVDDVDGCASLLDNAVSDAVDGGLTGVWVADDASLADVLAASLELRLDEDDGFASPCFLRRAESCKDCREDEGCGDEGDVHCEKYWGGFAVCDEFASAEEAGVSALAEGDAWVVAELLGDLAIAGVYCEDGPCATLQHTVGEASGGGADVDAGNASEGDGPVGEGVLEFETPATDVLQVGAEEADGCVGGDGGAGLVDALLVDEDTASEDEGLGTLAGGSVAMIDEELVEADLSLRAFVGWVILWSDSGLELRESCLYLFMVANEYRCGENSESVSFG